MFYLVTAVVWLISAMVYCCFSDLVCVPTYGYLQFFEPRVDKRVYEIGGNRKLEVDRTSSTVLLGAQNLRVRY